jgi:hypothetical protein
MLFRFSQVPAAGDDVTFGIDRKMTLLTFLAGCCLTFVYLHHFWKYCHDCVNIVTA